MHIGRYITEIGTDGLRSKRMRHEPRLTSDCRPSHEESKKSKWLQYMCQSVCLLLLPLLCGAGCVEIGPQVDKALLSAQFMAREFEELFGRIAGESDRTARDIYHQFAEDHSKALVDHAAERFGQEVENRTSKFVAHSRDFTIEVGRIIESYGPLARVGNAGFVPYIDDILRDISRIETDPGTEALDWPSEILYWQKDGKIEARPKDAMGNVVTVDGYGFSGRDRQLRYHQICIKGKDGQLRWVDPTGVTRAGRNGDHLEIALSKLPLLEGDQALRVRFLKSTLISIPLTSSELRVEEKDVEFEDAFAARTQNVLTVRPRRLGGTVFESGASRRWGDGGAEKSKAAFASVELRHWNNRIFIRPYVEISNYSDRSVATEQHIKPGKPAAALDPEKLGTEGYQWRELTPAPGTVLTPDWTFSRFISPDREGEHNYFQKHLGKQNSEDFGAGGILDRLVVWGTSGDQDDVGPGDSFTRAEFHLRKVKVRFQRAVAP